MLLIDDPNKFRIFLDHLNGRHYLTKFPDYHLQSSLILWRVFARYDVHLYCLMHRNTTRISRFTCLYALFFKNLDTDHVIRILAKDANNGRVTEQKKKLCAEVTTHGSPLILPLQVIDGISESMIPLRT